jgi:hypothetical protein
VTLLNNTVVIDASILKEKSYICDSSGQIFYHIRLIEVENQILNTDQIITLLTCVNKCTIVY